MRLSRRHGTRETRFQNITLRLEADVLERLEEIARDENESPNTLASRALRRYVEWENISVRYGFQSVTSEFLSKLMGYVPEEEVRKIGRWMSETVFRELTAYFFGNEELENALAVFELLATYGRRFKYDVHITGKKCMIVLRHDMSHKWSVLYEEVLKTRLETFLGKGVEELNLYRTENQVIAEFRIDSLRVNNSSPSVGSGA